MLPLESQELFNGFYILISTHLEAVFIEFSMEAWCFQMARKFLIEKEKAKMQLFTLPPRLKLALALL